MRRWGSILALLLVVLAPTEALAEGVRLRVAGRQDIDGQGWLFKDVDTGFCGVVTAAHVAAPSGHAGKVTILGAGKGEGFGDNIRILSSQSDAGDGGGLDIALMSVEGLLKERGCTTSTLGAADLTFMLSRSKRGVVDQISSSGEQTWQEIDFLGADLDDWRRLSLRPRNRDDRISEGYSGSAVVEAAEDRVEGGVASALPLAMITEVDEESGHARAVRFDAVRLLVKKALHDTALASPTAAGGVRLVGWQGETADLSCPAPNAAAPAAECGWRARPQSGQRSIALILAPSQAQASHLEFTLAGAVDAPVGVTVEVASAINSDAWIFAKSITTTAPSSSLDFLPMQCRRVRITFETRDGRPLEVRVLALR